MLRWKILKQPLSWWNPDNGPAVVGMGDLIDLGSGWGSMFEQFGLDYNWAIEGYADYASVEGLSITPSELPLQVSEAISAIQDSI